MNLFIENINEIKKIFNSNNDDFPTINPRKIKENNLYDNQILLHNAFFTPNEIVLIINDSEAAKVYELLRVKFYT